MQYGILMVSYQVRSKQFDVTHTVDLGLSLLSS